MEVRGDEGDQELDPRITRDVIGSIPGDPASPVGDIAFEETSNGFEILYSDRLAIDYQELVDQSADWLEGEMGLLNLGQIDHKLLVADGILTNEIKNGLIDWWTGKVGDLDLG